MEEDKKVFVEKTEEEKKKSKISIADFWDFFKNTSAIGLAVGVVMADAANKLINAVVNGLITPFISLFIPDSNFTALNINIGGSVFKFGDLIAALINIFIVSVLIYIIVKGILRREELLPEKARKTKAKVEKTELSSDE